MNTRDPFTGDAAVLQRPAPPGGAGLLTLRLEAIRYGADAINLFEFRRPEGGALPPFTAGAHIDLHLPGGLVRPYSLCNSQEDGDRYVVGVKRDPHGRGGSLAAHDELRVGSVIAVGPPRNDFAVREDAPHSVFIAGGIGITPIVSMIDRLRSLGRPWELHYSVRRRLEAAFLDRLRGDSAQLHVDQECGGLLDIAAAVAAAPPGAHLYCCGPAPMLDAFESATRGLPPAQVHMERFAAATEAAAEGGYTVELARSRLSLVVSPGQTLLAALRAHGVAVQASCEQGICGTCETRVLKGTPDHRDTLLSPEERASNEAMMICCSGSKSELLVLDL